MLDWIARTLAAASNAPTSAHLTEEPDQPFREAAGATVEDDEDQWRRLSGDAKRDLAPMTQERMQKVAAYLWESNQLGNRLVELPIAYLLSEGVRLTCDDEEHQSWLDTWWHDPINRMDERLPEFLRGLALFGELILPVFVNELKGRVRLGFLDPSCIEHIATDPDNRAQPIGIVTKRDARGRVFRYRVILLGEESDLFTPATRALREKYTDGEVFYLRLNVMPGGVRGRSDLLSQADWLDGYDQFLFGEMDRSAFLRSFVWDVALKGATPDEVEARAKKIAPPKPGSVRVHNDSEAWDAVTPGLQAADLSELARLLRNHVLGGATVPEHWFGGGGDVNRAVGAEMAEPTMKIMAMRQRLVKAMLEQMGRYVLWQRARINSQDEIDWSDDAWRVEAVFPEMSPKDTTKYAAALQQVIVAVGIAVEQGRLTELTALRLIAAVAGRLGIEIDAEQELADAIKERAERRAEDAYTEDDGDLQGDEGDQGDPATAPPADAPAQLEDA